MSFIKSLFAFDKRQQRGIFVLVGLLFFALLLTIFLQNQPKQKLTIFDTSLYQEQVDSLKEVASRKKDTIYPFNPNYITDYRGYRLGMLIEEIDRLHRFRESGKFVNSASDFQKVTGVTDQWLDSISPYFKFPEWVTNASSNRQSYTDNTYDKKVVRKDINKATASELRAVYGIGPALSGRLIDERERLGGFIDVMQVSAVYGLTDSTVRQLKKHFYINGAVDKIALNTATREQLVSIPYFNDYLVDELIKQRKLRDGFSGWDKVMLTSRFPEEKLLLIQLYLTLD